MAANQVTGMVAYTPDNDRCYNWRETIIITEDVKMDRCFLLEIYKKMGCLNKILEQRTNLQITWEGSKYGNIERNNVKIQNKNGEYPTCQNVDVKTVDSTQNLETKNTTKADIQIALQTGVKLCLSWSYDLSVARTRMWYQQLVLDI